MNRAFLTLKPYLGDRGVFWGLHLHVQIVLGMLIMLTFDLITLSGLQARERPQDMGNVSFCRYSSHVKGSVPSLIGPCKPNPESHQFQI